jgi:DNA-directed RNA polymerase subunit alpha
MRKRMVLGKVKKLEWEELSDTYGRLVAEPFKKGLGVTVGNSMRRMLLSAIEGAAVTSIKIDNILHEFSVIPGVVEDIVDIILNIKGVVFKWDGDKKKEFRLELKEKGKVCAGDLIVPQDVVIVNPDHHLLTISEAPADIITIYLEAKKGFGYLSADETKREKRPGTIPIDAYFSPVVKVAYRIEDVRVGRVVDYEKLILEVTTDGSITPQDAVDRAASILSDYIAIFIKPEGFIEEEPLEEEIDKEQERLRNILNMKIDEMEISVRASNCLRVIGAKKIADLVKMTEADLLKMRNFGKKSLTEIKEKLAGYNLTLGMTNIDHLIEKEEDETQEEEE